MAVCEQCWTEASREVMLFGGSVVDRYRKLIAAFPDGHGDADKLPNEEQL